MAITKAINKQTKSHGAMRNCIEYVLRESKIKDGLLDITGPYAFDSITYDLVYKSFKEEKEIWKKDNGRMYAHHVISFHKDEKITAEQAFEFGKTFAEQVFGDYQTLISVHQDKNHLHIHFVTNSVSFIDGYKLHISAKELEKMKQLTNNMCREQGLTVAQKGKHFDGTDIAEGAVSAWSKDKYNMVNAPEKDSFISKCFSVVMEVIQTACSQSDFVQKMKERGWGVVWKEGRKNITFTDSEGNKVRDSNLSKTFNADICKESLEKHFAINAEREEYYKAVENEISVENNTGGKKSVLADLNKKKQEVAKTPRKKKVSNKSQKISL